MSLFSSLLLEIVGIVDPHRCFKKVRRGKTQRKTTLWCRSTSCRGLFAPAPLSSAALALNSPLQRFPFMCGSMHAVCCPLPHIPLHHKPSTLSQPSRFTACTLLWPLSPFPCDSLPPAMPSPVRIQGRFQSKQHVSSSSSPSHSSSLPSPSPLCH